MNGKQTVFVTWFCVFLLLSCQFTNIDARKTSQRKTGSSTSSAHVSRPTSSNSHADQAKLSYAGYNSAPNPPKAQQPVASAPAPVPPPLPLKPNSDANKPIGWNVQEDGVQKQTVHNTNAAPYPHQPQQSPPAYSPNPVQSGPPPAYSNNPPPYHAPPPYSGGKLRILIRRSYDLGE